VFDRMENGGIKIQQYEALCLRVMPSLETVMTIIFGIKFGGAKPLKP